MTRASGSSGRFQLGEEYQGGTGFLHGGIIALLLDEVMSKATRFHAEHAVTADLHVEYKRPIRVGQEIVVEGFVARRDGRQLYHEGEIRNEAGELLARGEGRFVVIDPEKFGHGKRLVRHSEPALQDRNDNVLVSANLGETYDSNTGKATEIT